jgi:hypothetical protein
VSYTRRHLLTCLGSVSTAAAFRSVASPMDWLATTDLPALVASIRDDFAHGRVVNVDGWLVSETEWRLCKCCD